MKMRVLPHVAILLSLGVASHARAEDPCHPSSGARNVGNFTPLTEQTDEILSAFNDSGDTGSVKYVPGTSKKVCQLIGDVDFETGKPTTSQTASRAGVFETDLGFSFEHDGKLYFLFGDTKPAAGVNRAVDEDAIASSNLGINPKNCIDLNFVKDQSDGAFRPAKIPGLNSLSYDVPVGGVSANGKMYVYFTTDHTDQKLMGRSVLGVSLNDGYSFHEVYDFSSDKFINVTPVKRDKKIYLFGSGSFRESDPYLSVVDESKFEKKGSLRYFAGLTPKNNKPKWSSKETDAKPLFDQPCLGELSTNYDAALGKWIMLYNCDSNPGINMRTATHPWGPWTSPQVIFEPSRDQAVCKFVHREVDDTHPACDQMASADDDGGSAYGPYMIPGLSETHGDTTTIYYTVSTWSPYTVILMKTTLQRK